MSQPHVILQLNPPIPLETPRGKGLAILVIDMGVDYDLWFTVIQDETREIWTVRNNECRGVENITLGRAGGVDERLVMSLWCNEFWSK